MMSRRLPICCLIALAALVLATSLVHAEEVWLYDNSRVYGLVQGVSEDGSRLIVLLPTGKEQAIRLEEIIAIRFLGRNPLLVQSGTQEFRFVNGGWIRGQILENVGDVIKVRTAMAGVIDVNFKHLRGFVALPLAGFSGRKAEELVDSEYDPRLVSRFLSGARGADETAKFDNRLGQHVDLLLDDRGGVYPGVVRQLERTTLHLYHERLVRIVPIRVLYVAGVRTAESARVPVSAWKNTLQMRIHGRDGSVVECILRRIHLGKWEVNPVWNLKQVLRFDLDEISLVQIMGGRVQYLSQIKPAKKDVKEQTILAPPQPFQLDRSCQGDAISIAGKRYPWGIGVHADSELTFELNGRFREFRSDVGIATRMGNRGSVVFTVSGDGKEKHKTPVIRGSAEKPHSITVNVKGVKRLTLKVTNAGDLDLGDVANWGSARVLR
jgi:hypothetical protein